MRLMTGGLTDRAFRWCGWGSQNIPILCRPLWRADCRRGLGAGPGNRRSLLEDGRGPGHKILRGGNVGWINQQQEDVIDYLREEVRILKELQGKRRLRFTDEQRRRLARKAKRIRFDRLKEVVGVVSGLVDCFATTTGTRHELDDFYFWTLRRGRC